MLSNTFKKILSGLVLIAFMATSTGFAEARPKSFPDSVDANHGALAAAAATEATNNSNEQILVAYVGIKHAKVSGKSIANVIYTTAFQGPYKNQQPWTRKNTKARYYSAADTIRPHYVAFSQGGDFLPDHLKHYENVQHFDSASHEDWGNYLGMEGGTCFYTAKKTKGARANTCAKDLAKVRGGPVKVYAAKHTGKKKAVLASKKSHGKKTELASKKLNGKAKLVATNGKKAPKALSNARGLEVATR